MQAALKTKAAAELAQRELQERTFEEQQAARQKMLSDLASGFESKIGSLVVSLEVSATEMETSARRMSESAEQTSVQTLAVAASAEETSVNVNTIAGST